MNSAGTSLCCVCTAMLHGTETNRVVPDMKCPVLLSGTACQTECPVHEESGQTKQLLLFRFAIIYHLRKFLVYAGPPLDTKLTQLSFYLLQSSKSSMEKCGNRSIWNFPSISFSKPIPLKTQPSSPTPSTPLSSMMHRLNGRQSGFLHHVFFGKQRGKALSEKSVF